MIRLVMERAGLTFWPILSFLIFLVSSGIITLWMFRPGSKEFYGKLSKLALDNDDSLKGKA